MFFVILLHDNVQIQTISERKDETSWQDASGGLFCVESCARLAKAILPVVQEVRWAEQDAIPFRKAHTPQPASLAERPGNIGAFGYIV